MTAPTRLFSHSQSARFYNALGATLDTQSFYEAAALRDLAAHLELETSRSVVEFGCGTGRFAAELLRAHLSPEATYLGVDNSTTMVDLARSRLRQFGERAHVTQSDGSPSIPAADGACDRFISTYVLDLLTDDDIRAVLREARRLLKPEGLLGLISLTNGVGPISRTVSTVWRGLHRVSPWLIGGCRPIALRSFFSNAQWRVKYCNVIVRFGVPSEIIVARPAL